MSGGPGRVERAIRQLFDANPDRAFITDELVEHCYPDIEYIEKKHTVAVLRAAHKIVAADPNWRAWEIGEGRNVGLCFFNYDSVESYVLGRLIRMDVSYRAGRGSRDRWAEIEGFDELRAMLDTERYRQHMAPGGVWHRHVETHRAERDGDTETAAALKARGEAELEALAEGIRGDLHELHPPDPRESVRTVLAGVAEELRALAAENDPDVIRERLGAIADALESAVSPETPSIG